MNPSQCVELVTVLPVIEQSFANLLMYLFIVFSNNLYRNYIDTRAKLQEGVFLYIVTASLLLDQVCVYS